MFLKWRHMRTMRNLELKCRHMKTEDKTGIKVSTHGDSTQQSKIKVSTHRVEESTHKDSRQTRIKVSTHALRGVDT